jgi:uncharacterized protein YbaP (TraB family)
MLFQLCGTSVHLLGSSHIGRDEVVLPPEAVKVIAEAKLLAWESNHEAAGAAFQASFRPGASLANSLNPKLLEQVHSLADAVGADVEAIDRADPWQAELLLFIALALGKGHSIESSADVEVRKRARAAGAKDYFLESPSAALDAFAQSPLEEQTANLQRFVDAPELFLARLDRILKACQTSDLDDLEKVLGIVLSEMPVTYDNLLRKRNLLWLPKIRALVAKGRKTVICVGAFHLVGEFGLPSLLGRNGIEVSLA